MFDLPKPIFKISSKNLPTPTSPCVVVSIPEKKQKKKTDALQKTKKPQTPPPTPDLKIISNQNRYKKVSSPVTSKKKTKPCASSPKKRSYIKKSPTPP